jgi:hypothetical protein
MKIKTTKKSWMMLAAMATIFSLSLIFITPVEASDAWTKAGITPNGNIKNSNIYNDLKDLVWFITALGGFWVLACLIFAGVKLSAAQGGNPQARTAGFIGLGMAFLGGWVIMKAYDIAGWIAGFGS